jgi:hypothetical protein
MTGTRAASVIADCARCLPNAPLLGVGLFVYCEAKIAFSNSLAGLGVFPCAHTQLGGACGFRLGFHVPFLLSVLSS